MFKNFFQQKGTKNKQEKVILHCPQPLSAGYPSSSTVNETYEKYSTFVPSSAVASQIPAEKRSPSPLSQCNALLATTQSSGDGIAIEFGPNANFAQATGVIFGAHNTLIQSSHKSYHIRLGDRELTESQVQEFMAGLLTLPDKMMKIVTSQTSTNLPCAMAAHNDYIPQKEHVPCFIGTRKVVLREIGNWFIAIGPSQIYVLSGLAGIGKSTIAYTVAQRADRLGLLGASFFFSRKESERRTAEKFFTTIAFQLCTYDAKFAHAIEMVLATHRGKSATTKDPETQLNVLIIEPLQDLVRNRTQPVVIVVDALDECENKDAQIIVKALGHLVKKIPSFKVILTTRPQPHLDHLLSSHDIFYLHKIEDKIVNDDIRSYLKFKLSMEQVKSILPTLRTPWNVKDDDIDDLVQAAGKLFIIASISVLFILDTNVRNPASQMKKLRNELARNRTRFVALDDFYPIILNAVVPPGSECALVERFQKVVGAIVLLYDPLPVRALAHLIDFEEDDIYGVLDNLQSVILLGEDGIPYIYHKSFSDWIMDTEHCKSKDHLITSTEGHTWLTIRCLQTMNERLKRNMFDINGVAQFMTSREALKWIGIKEGILQKISSELQYACIYWACHLNEANVDDADLISKSMEFANEHWLHWIEVWGWLSSEITFRLRLDGTHRFMQKTTFQELRQLFYDGRRFFFKFCPLIQRSALSTYHSALPFAPTESLFYQRYEKEMIDNICRVQGGPKRWDAVIANDKHGQYVDRVMFGERGASAFVTCSTNCIKFWNRFSGSLIKTVLGDTTALSDGLDVVAVSQNKISIEMMHGLWSTTVIISATIQSIALSSNNRRLAVALSNGKISLVAVEELKKISVIHKFESDSHSSYEPCHLAFSPNNERLAYRLTGGGAAYRNAVDGEHIADLNYKSMMVHRLAFSPDGYQLASVVVEDDMHTLTLWNCTDGRFLKAVQNVGSELAFSPDGTLLATGGLNNAVKLWSRKTEDQTQGFCFIETPHLSSVEGTTCLAFSQDGILAVGSANSEIILYDVTNHSLIAMVPFRNPTAIAFSHDCTRLGIGNADGIFRLLDVPTIKASSQTSQGRSAPVSVLMFSPDCSRIVSGSEDGIIRIWNTSCIDEPIATCKGHSSKITTLAFTPDGRQFACGDATGTIKFWSSDDCALYDTVQWPISGELTSVAISKDLLAGATSDSISLWDRQKSCIIDHLGECGSVQLAFSNDEENLLLASFDDDSRSVAVWDVRSRTRRASFSVDNMREEIDLVRMVFNLDDSKLLVHGQRESDLFRLFDFAEHRCHGVQFSDLAYDGIFPSWRGIPVYMCSSNHRYCIAGRFGQGDGDYSMKIACYIPEDFEVVKAAYGSSMFALLCKNGSLVLLQCNEN